MTAQFKVILAEKDAQRGQALVAAFQRRGWVSEVAVDAAAALAAIRRVVPDVVVLNTDLPAGGSMIILKRMRASASAAATPVLTIGQVPPEEVQAFRAAGAREHVPAGDDGEAVCAAILGGATAPEVTIQAPAEPLRSPLRMAALRASGLLDSPPEEAFDRLTRLVANLLGTPVGLLSLVDEDRQFFKSQVGLPEPWASTRQTPLTHSFCQWVVTGREPVSVVDAREHPLLRHNKAIQDLGVVAYAGVPVHSAQGEALGSLCAIDAQPRVWGTRDEVLLQDLARLAESWIARSELVRNPPRGAADLDPYAEAAGSAIGAAVDILRREGGSLADADRELLYDLVTEYGHHLVQLNRLIQVNQSLT